MTKLLVGNLKDVDIKGSRKLQVGDTEIALFRLSSGEVLAVENKCPHKGGLLSEGMVCGSKVHCPLHDWRIELHTGEVQAPDTGHVTTYEVEVDPLTGSLYLTI
ncbi:nitrite reductase small subunit NirD [Paenibacillus tritici]|uniref:Nitrite reductase small subunit NirD n=1 Tax=Paenibacillus tritici TaxID=1873425 RepID=A0ABX2DHY1_9BACL|nr:nitrite reductase small subunit NirD [Paenibacillus tritici]NQX44220.1 nitrite reductase small subunit NirD [Paenibacillus tritici]QUL58231.1 nitrite reductase small subunit NirD [Paenibacillus tritici]